MSSLLSFVNVEAGTHSHFGFSTGNCLPLTAFPFGLVHWAPQTAQDTQWFFHPDHQKFQGFRATHQPSPWIGDYGSILMMPFVGEPPRFDADGLASAYQRELRPDFAQVTLTRYQMTASLAPTRTGALLRLECHTDNIVKLCVSKAVSVELAPDSRYVHVLADNAAGGVPKGFACYYVLKFPTEIKIRKVGDDRWEISTQESLVNISVASSFISFQQARLNLVHDQSHPATSEWERIFGQFSLSASERQKQVFANCLFRASLFPRETFELDANGEPHHYSFFHGKVEPGISVTDNGFWDTYRTVYPWFNLFAPSRSEVALNGWVSALREGGWFPQWASPGYRACMVGTHIDAVFADAVAKGVLGFPLKEAFEGLMKHAYQPGDAAGSYGRLGIEDYVKLGYVAEETVEGSVARSLDYAYNDWCISQIAKHLGENSKADELQKRSSNYRKLFNDSVGFMNAKHADGSWSSFREFQWGGPYVEGGPWQSSWAVQHDPDGLAELYGGEEKLAEKLLQIFEVDPFFEIGHYGFEIHEMTEMAQAGFGQYAQSNQPVHHVIYFLLRMKDRRFHERALVLLRRVMQELYTPDKFPGDEDNGEMACWYLWSALGVFPFCPGSDEYVVGECAFERFEATLENGKKLTILGGKGWPKWNGNALNRRIVKHESLIKGGELSFRD
jgi:predicted alpha-1,2-mannosidase